MLIVHCLRGETTNWNILQCAEESDVLCELDISIRLFGWIGWERGKGVYSWGEGKEEGEGERRKKRKEGSCHMGWGSKRKHCSI